MMRINITSEQHEKITSICNKYDIEVSGIISLKEGDSGYDVVDIDFDDRELIRYANSSCIHFNGEEYKKMLAYGIATSQTGLFVRFHTHLYSLSARLSMDDFNMLKQNQETALEIANIKETKPVIVSETIVTSGEIGFFYFDPDERKCKRIPVYVDGKEREYKSEILVGSTPVRLKFGTLGFIEDKKK